MTNVVVIGNAQFVVDCVGVLQRTADVTVRLVISDPAVPTIGGLVERCCRVHGLTHISATDINSDRVLEAVAAAQPDFLFSAYNMQIMKRGLLALPTRATVNFHNGPLPRYRGVNVYSWAIINGEREYGVTWHYAGEAIDAGDILAQRIFPLAHDETPLTLSRRGFAVGVELLAEMATPLIRGQIDPVPQDHAQASSYSRKDTPNGGRTDFGWPFDRLERFVRGLNYYPIRNPFVYATATVNGAPIHPLKLVRFGDQTGAPPGAVVDVERDMLRVACGDAVLGITEALDANRRLVPIGELARLLGIQVGDRLT
jgi:methionyl-tRNA formyltransferase